MLYFLVGLLLFSCPLSAQELRIFYQDEHPGPRSLHEEHLIQHVKTSLDKALKLESKLTGLQFKDDEATHEWRKATIPHYHTLSDLDTIPYYHLLNNLCTLEGATHLQVGLLAGDSLIAALYGNQSCLKQKIGVDWFKECSELFFHSNCSQYLDLNDYEVIKGDCFKIKKDSFDNPIDIYFYDADHSLSAHEKAFTYYNDVFADTFVAVIDDWECSWIRGPTFKAFKKLGYSVLYECTLPKKDVDHGQYVAVIRKSTNTSLSKEYSLDSEHLHNPEFQDLKKRLHDFLRNRLWYVEEKVNLIMDVVAMAQPKVCVEIGAGVGSSFLPIAATLHYLGKGHAYSIDAWSIDEAVKGIPEGDYHERLWSSINMPALQQEFVANINAWSLSPWCTGIASPSREAVSQFGAIDFLHLDGNYSEEGALADAEMYLPKVVPGGYILLSNLFLVSDKKCQKMKSLWYLLDHCEVIAQVEYNGSTVLFQKL